MNHPPNAKSGASWGRSTRERSPAPAALSGWWVVLWSVIILLLSTMPGVNLPESLADLFSWDKLAHCIVYGTQVYLALRYFGRPTAGQTLGVLIGSFLYGAAMEGIQYGFFPGRYFELLDIAANAVGSLLGWLLFRGQLRRRAKVGRSV